MVAEDFFCRTQVRQWLSDPHQRARNRAKRAAIQVLVAALLDLSMI